MKHLLSGPSVDQPDRDGEQDHREGDQQPGLDQLEGPEAVSGLVHLEAADALLLKVAPTPRSASRATRSTALSCARVSRCPARSIKPLSRIQSRSAPSAARAGFVFAPAAPGSKVRTSGA